MNCLIAAQKLRQSSKEAWKNERSSFNLVETKVSNIGCNFLI
jgi:hypothetical protein